MFYYKCSLVGTMNIFYFGGEVDETETIMMLMVVLTVDIKSIHIFCESSVNILDCKGKRKNLLYHKMIFPC